MNSYYHTTLNTERNKPNKNKNEYPIIFQTQTLFFRSANSTKIKKNQPITQPNTIRTSAYLYKRYTKLANNYSGRYRATHTN